MRQLNTGQTCFKIYNRELTSDRVSHLKNYEPANASIQTTIRHWLAMDPLLARPAIGKFRGWLDKEGTKL